MNRLLPSELLLFVFLVRHFRKRLSSSSPLISFPSSSLLLLIPSLSPPLFSFLSPSPVSSSLLLLIPSFSPPLFSFLSPSLLLLYISYHLLPPPHPLAFSSNPKKSNLWLKMLAPSFFRRVKINSLDFLHFQSSISPWLFIYWYLPILRSLLLSALI